MRPVCLAALLFCLCLALSACGAGEVEHQAYALVLGIDEAEAGGIGLTIRLPRYGQKPSSDGASGGESDAYMAVSASGDSYAQALEHLQWAVARELNLSQLKLVVVSEALAASGAFRDLISQVAETRHLYTTAGFVVCAGDARRFVEAEKTLLGTRLSSEINAMFRHYAEHGFIPKATLAELYYATRSGCADPTGIWGYQGAGEDGAESALALIATDSEAIVEGSDTGAAQHYLGSAVFHNGRLACKLNAAETLYMNLLSGKVGSFDYSFGGRAWPLTSLRGPRHRIHIGEDGVTIEVTVYCASEEHIPQALIAAMEADFSSALSGIISRCQSLGVEPFGFSRTAMWHFGTVEDWQAYDWCSRFSSATVSTKVRIVNAPE